MILVGAIALWLAMVLAGWTMIASAAAVRTGRADLALSGYRALLASGIAIGCGVAGVVRAVTVGEFRMIDVQLVAGRSGLPSVQTALLMSASWWWMLVLLLLAIGTGFAERPSAQRGTARVSAGRVGVVGAALLVGLVLSREWFDPYEVGVVSAAALGVLDEPRGISWALHRWLAAGGVALVAWCVAAVSARLLMRRTPAPPAATTVTAWIASTLALVAGWWWRYAIDGAIDVRSAHWSLRIALVCWGVATVLLTLLPGRAVRAGLLSRVLRWSGATSVVLGMIAQDRARTERIELPASVARRTSDLFGASWTLTSQGASYFVRDGVESLLLAIALQRGSTREGIVTTEQRRYPVGNDAPPPDRVFRGVHRGLAQDLFVKLDGSSGRDVAVVELRFVPGVSLVWIGSAMLLLGMVSTVRRREGA
jgi:cytochrome c biogenesis factor